MLATGAIVGMLSLIGVLPSNDFTTYCFQVGVFLEAGLFSFALMEKSRSQLESEVEQATNDLRNNVELIEEQNARLDIARKDAIKASNVKSQFLANMSHEIRTPLNAILGFSKELNNASLPTDQQEQVRIVNTAADNLLTIVNDVLDFSKIEALEGWGRQSAANLKYSIDLKKTISLEKFIYSLGIRHIGLENAKLISKNLKSIKNFISLSKKKNFDELINIDGIGETQITSIKNFFSNETNLRVINELDKVLKIRDAIQVKKDGSLVNKTFMLTGKLEGISRAEAKSLIEQNSGSIISNVSKKLNYLIIGGKPTKRKIELAKELKIKIINQKELLQMLNETS